MLKALTAFLLFSLFLHIYLLRKLEFSNTLRGDKLTGILIQTKGSPGKAHDFLIMFVSFKTLNKQVTEENKLLFN